MSASVYGIIRSSNAPLPEHTTVIGEQPRTCDTQVSCCAAGSDPGRGHPGLRAVWAVNDGIVDDTDSGSGLFLDRHALLPVATAADIRDDLCDSFDEDWGRLWLPLTTNEVNEPWMGSSIDCGSGRLGAWSMEDAPGGAGGMSFADLLAAVVEAVKDGRGR
ncbi:hypothetical protein [Streptomyces sp. NPDC087437]|uniref:hypothetical protein n=1 Tax=Streptomyces sp. NPDC087437 TaxID=3365789 RepID=UPI00380546F5